MAAAMTWETSYYIGADGDGQKSVGWLEVKGYIFDLLKSHAVVFVSNKAKTEASSQKALGVMPLQELIAYQIIVLPLGPTSQDIFLESNLFK